MPPLQRKLTCPENSTSYLSYCNETIDSVEQHNERPPRKIDVESGLISKAKGSAYLTMGNTKVIVCALDPREMSKQNRKTLNNMFKCEFKYAPFAYSSKHANRISSLEQFYAIALVKAINPAICRVDYPNFMIDISVIVLEDDGSVLSTAINCTLIALADAGIALLDIVTASTVIAIDKKFFIDPSKEEEELYYSYKNTESDYCMAVVTLLDAQKEIAKCFHVGYYSPELFENINLKALKRNSSIAKRIKSYLTIKVQNTIDI